MSQYNYNYLLLYGKYLILTLSSASFSLMNDNSSQILFIDNGGKPNVGEAITLRCGACGYPTPSYEWHDTNDEKLKTSDVYEVRLFKRKEMFWCLTVQVSRYLFVSRLF